MNLKQKSFVSAVIYIFNAEYTLGDFLKTLYGILDKNFEKFEMVCVNDASTDNSADIVRKLAGGFCNCTLSIVNMSHYQGVEAAMHAGVDTSIGDFVFEFDSLEMDYDPGLVMQVYDRSLQGFDIVSCGKGYTRASSKIFYSVYNRHSGTQYKLKSETFRIISRRAINRVHSMTVNLPYRKAVYFNCGLKADYIHYKPADTGKKNRRPLRSPYDTAFTALMLFTDIAYKVTLTFTFIMMILTLGSIGYVITIYLLGNPIEGYTTMMLFISGVFLALFTILVIIIKYLSVILGLVFNKQKYMIGSIEKVGEEKA